MRQGRRQARDLQRLPLEHRPIAPSFQSRPDTSVRSFPVMSIAWYGANGHYKVTKACFVTLPLREVSITLLCPTLAPMTLPQKPHSYLDASKRLSI